ncbi:KilA-N domain-containing protein [Delftia tsuruhatensis]|uniref:KilA-N domain-containing protein n=1 Tax=Delftia tsuruhatensis TaxID=180282 RepID=UPI002260F666|nr:KilA-N domain-containing protein [Delftia tsuruhatensis]MCX7509404.1 KilA-N domain-containing protein [Delftia tsuruhatensis]
MKGINMANSTAVTIGGTAVRQAEGLYSLNDLHKESGGLANHRPGYFLDNEQTKALVREIETAGIPAVKTRQGRNGGTYACKELVIAYAAWISAKFHLKVIRVFLAVTAPKAVEPAGKLALTDCGDKAKVSKFLADMRKRAVQQLVQLDKQIAEWEVLDAPAPAERVKIEVMSVVRAPGGAWVMEVVSGMCGFTLSMPNKVLPRGGVKVGDKLDAYYAAGGDPWRGPWVRVDRRDVAPRGATKYAFGSNYAALEIAA